MLRGNMRKLMLWLALSLSSVTYGATLDNIVVFGDSLSDNGNLYEYMQHRIPQSPPYYRGRFTNGPVWVEHLAKSCFPKNSASHLLDYAFGGAGIAPEDDDVLFTLKREIDSYLLVHEGKASDKSLYIVWIGANNYLGIPDNPDETVLMVREGLSNGLQRLAKAGAKQVMVVNLPDLGLTPIAREFSVEQTLSDMAQKHNQALTDLINQMQAQYPGVTWLQFDVNAMLREVMANPAQYGYDNITDSCYESELNKTDEQLVLTMGLKPYRHSDQDKCALYLFFDPIHPEARAHEMMGQQAKVLLDNARIHFGG